MRPLLLIAAALLCACQHKPVVYASSPKSGIFSIAKVSGGQLMAPGWEGYRPADKADDEVDYLFRRDSDGAWVAAFGFVSEHEASFPIEEGLSRTRGELIMRAMRLAKKQPGPELIMSSKKEPALLDGAAGDAAETVLTTDHPALRLYAAVVRRGRTYVFVLEGVSRGDAVISEEGRDLVRRIRFDSP
ncbi:MAG TPA: hypothetical protein VH083_00485 [Myxococcales bacterium]|nr:hypothetical protein [Myxococcales bacterium]